MNLRSVTDGSCIPIAHYFSCRHNHKCQDHDSNPSSADQNTRFESSALHHSARTHHITPLDFISSPRTPFHADVFRSYSWSANICGRKRWLLFPPGQEDYLRDTLGNLVYDLTSRELHDENKYPHYRDACEPFEVIQGPGEVIFVPSGWHHQVFNIVSENQTMN